jgi:hypothetical protein
MFLVFGSSAFLFTMGALQRKVNDSGEYMEACWEVYGFLIDPGRSFSEDVPYGDFWAWPPIPRTIAMITTLGGILILAILVGLIVEGIQSLMTRLKAGTTAVAEQGHTLMLGWTEYSIDIIREICDANASDGGGVIVVMSELGTADLENDFSALVTKKELAGTRVVFRRGNVLNGADLVKVAAHRARCTIVLVDNAMSPDEADATAMRIVLCLRGLPYMMEGHVIVTLRDVDNEPLIATVGGDFIETLVSHDLIGRLMLMSARQPGLANVYTELLGFTGDEFYVSEWPELARDEAPFDTLHLRMPDAIPIGIRESSGNIILNPAPDRTMKRGEQVIVIAEDDNTYGVADLAPQTTSPDSLPPYQEKPQEPETILITGWRRDIRDMLQLLDGLVAQREIIHPDQPQGLGLLSQTTKVYMLNEVPLYRRTALLEEGGLDVSMLKNIEIIHVFGCQTRRKVLSALPLCKFDSILLLVDSAGENDPLRSDSNILASLLIIRSIQNVQKNRFALTLLYHHVLRHIAHLCCPPAQQMANCAERIEDPQLWWRGGKNDVHEDGEAV